MNNRKIKLKWKLRLWLWVYFKLSTISVKRYYKSLVNNKEKNQGEYIAKFTNYIYKKKIKPNAPKHTLVENYKIN